MKKNETVFDYVGQIFMIFGFTIICLNVFCILFGESARNYSSIFSLGSDGLRITTMLQFLLTAAIITTLKFLFFTQGLIKQAPIWFRTACMFTLILLTMIVFTLLFGWFPINMWQPWVMFFLCFSVSAGISTAIASLKEKLENKQLEEALKQLKQKENIDDNPNQCNKSYS